LASPFVLEDAVLVRGRGPLGRMPISARPDRGTSGLIVYIQTDIVLP